MENSKKNFVLVTTEKIGHRTGALLASWEAGLRLITDATARLLAAGNIPTTGMEKI
jgi:DeoR/GlpR family transcriptional regulator of sugar metabolism